MTRAAQYEETLNNIRLLLDGEDDWVAAMATVVCELHRSFAYYHWPGFNRVTQPELLVIGPYQGGHGCTRIEFSRGVCGAAARTQQTQLVPDVHAFAGHIACASSTLSEVVVPVVRNGQTIAVIDVDSDDPAAFTEEDQKYLEQLAEFLAVRYAGELP